MKEHQHIEWKESWRDEYLKWLSGFANAEGGVLVIGRNDRGQAVGVKDARRLLVDIPNKVRDVLGVMVDVNLITEKGKELVEIKVEPYPSPISYKGQYHYRSGSTKQELRGVALEQFLLRKRGLHWDGVPEPSFSPKACSADALRLFKQRAASSGRMDQSVLRDSRSVILDNLELLEKRHLKRAACLLFADRPERYVSGAWVKIGFFVTDDDLLYQDEVHGSLFEQAESTLELLLTKYLRAYISYEGLQRKETFLFPDGALREALLNAIVHKDYSTGVPIQISVYHDKIVMWNPGHLPQGWTLKRLLGKHPSNPPNPLLASAFFRAGYIEAWGRGIEKIRRECREHDIEPPVYDFGMSGLMLTFHANPEHLPAETPVETPVETLPEMTPETRVENQGTPPETPKVTGEVAGEVTGEVTRMLLVCRRPMTRRELQGALRLKGDDNFRRLYLVPALKAGLIEMTIPDKPKSRLQKYRLSAAGVALVGSLRKGRPDS